MPEGKTNNPKGINQYTKSGATGSILGGGGAAFGRYSGSGANRPTWKTLPGSAENRRDTPIVSSGRGNLEAFYKRVDPFANAGQKGASIGGAAERLATKASGALQGLKSGAMKGAQQSKTALLESKGGFAGKGETAVAKAKGAIKGAISGAKQGAMSADLNFAENSSQRGAAKGEAIARKVAATMQNVNMATEKAKDTAKASLGKIRTQMWGK